MRPDAGTAGNGATASRSRSFLVWSAAAYVGVAAVLVAAVVARTGELVYVLDDPAIHLSMARQLTEHGTWGVAAGDFQSASSSPLWTVLVAAGTEVAPAGDVAVPLVLNLLSGLALLAVLAADQQVLRPERRRPWDAAATTLLAVVVLFLPALALVGMEHTLHAALVVAAVAVVRRQLLGGTAAPPTWLAPALLALAALTRFETVFVTAGLVVGVLVAAPRPGPRPWRLAATLATATAVPLLAFGFVNLALGGLLLPNSVLAKGRGVGTGNSVHLTEVALHLAADPLVVACLLVAAGVLVLRGPTSPAALPAITLAVATTAHVALADMGWFERYQAYLLALGVYLVLCVLGLLPAAAQRRAVVLVAVASIGFGLIKVDMLARVPDGADDMFRQQVQAARFLDRYYDGQPVATDQLGYISLIHDGPVTDLAGLGDREVLDARRHDRFDAAFVDGLADRRGFRVAVTPDNALLRALPETWLPVGYFEIDRPLTSSVDERMTIWATDPHEVERLIARLAEFAEDLPDGVRYTDNPLVGFAAADLIARDAAQDGGDGGDEADGDGG